MAGELSQVLHFTLGPVQGFVAQARRTRDFWAGSFLLSYLAGQAMACVLQAGGRLILPAVAEDRDRVTDPLLAAILRLNAAEKVLEGPSLATLPNRFQARVPEGFDPEACVRAVRRAWEELAAAVWRRYVEPVAAQGRATATIWQRQVGGFWDLSWVVGPEPALLERRKNWRSYVPPVEEGDKCTLMGSWQELSGYVRSREREPQEAFWAAIRQRIGGHELGEEERLCAIALIKRLLPLVSREVLWELPARYPSTPFIAAVPWIRGVIRAHPEAARHYAAKAVKLGGYKEDPDSIAGLKEELKNRPEAREFASLDANCFFPAALANPRLWGASPSESEELRRELSGALRELGPPASPFYGLLLMDGDRLGRLLGEYGHSRVSAALQRFSEQVQELVRRHDGVTVYAGGDDVLALLPLDGALPAAIALRRAYGDSFREESTNRKIPATISGAIVYAHYSTPLTTVVREAHRLLDEVAKEQIGRDSLAITVWRGPGPVLTWAAPWDVFVEGEGNLIDRLATQMGGADPEKESEREFTTSFFYRLHQYLEWLKTPETEDERTLSDLVEVLTAQYLRIRELKVEPERARERVRALLRLCFEYRREADGGIRQIVGRPNPGGALLVKFLAQKGVGE
ncbi:MAG: type III-B CRISPR-associated protein Cas10/Cmr2 [Moorellales bacterium]